MGVAALEFEVLLDGVPPNGRCTPVPEFAKFVGRSVMPDVDVCGCVPFRTTGEFAADVDLCVPFCASDMAFRNEDGGVPVRLLS